MSAFAPALEARRLLRAADRAALATALAPDAGAPPPLASGWPLATLVLLTVDHAGRPLLLLSDLALHARGIGRDARVALLVDGTAGREDPLTGPRVTVVGDALAVDDAAAKERVLRRHPSAALYARFADFKLYLVYPSAAHYVAGFGKVHWVAADALLFGGGRGDLAEAEPVLIAEINGDGAPARMARHLLGRRGRNWRLVGIDPEGIDLRQAGDLARLEFKAPVGSAAEARAEIQRLARAAGRMARRRV